MTLFSQKFWIVGLVRTKFARASPHRNLNIVLFVLHITMNKGYTLGTSVEANSKPHVTLVHPDLLDSGNYAESVRRITATPVRLCSLHFGFMHHWSVYTSGPRNNLTVYSSLNVVNYELTGRFRLQVFVRACESY